MNEQPVYICIPTTVERKERLEVLKESLRVNAGYPYIVATYENFQEGFIKPIHKLLSGLKPDTLVWCIGDDTLLIEKDTLKRLVEAYKPSCVVNPNDGIQCGAIITMPLCSAETMKKGTYIGYFLNSADVEFTMVLTAQKKYIYLPDVNVQHSHWRNGKAPRDKTYTFADEMAGKDAQMFLLRKEAGFDDNELLQ